MSPVVSKVRSGKPSAVPGRTRTRIDRPSLELSLPTKPNKPPKTLWEYICFIYGDKGVGKSTLSAQFPGSFTYMAEPRRRNLPIYQVPDPNTNEGPLTWDRCRRYRDLLLQTDQFQTIVMDTTDRMYALCQDYICKRANCNHPSDKNDYGKTWNELKVEFEEFIRSFLESGRAVLPISHSRNREVRTVTGEEYEQVTPTAPDACWTIWKALSDFAFYYGYYRRQRVIYLRGSDEIWASCGTSEDHFLNPKGEPLAFIYAGETPADAYKNLCDSFENKVEGVTVEQLLEGVEDEQDDEPVSIPKKKRR